MRIFLTLIVYIFLGLPIACNYSGVNITGRPSTEYHRTQKKLTQYKKVYAIEKVIFDTRIVYFSDQLRLQYVDEYASMFHLSEEEKEALLRQHTEEGEQFDDFYIAHFSSEIGYQKLQEKRDDKKIWTLRLQDGVSELRPISIDPLKRTNHQEYFFPFMDGFSKLYKVRFRKTTNTTKTMSMHSPARSTTFEWK